MGFANNFRYLLQHPITRRDRLRAVGRWLRWQSGSRLLGNAVICDWVGDVRFIARRGEAGLTGNIYCGLHEFPEMGFLLHFLRAGDLFVDVGANVGSYSLLAGGVVGAQGIAFEPVPETFERLTDNIRLNRLDGVVHCRRCAVGSSPGSIAFTSKQNTMNRAVAPGEVCDSSVKVEVVDLDSALGGANPVLMKVDVEGFESEVIRGAASVLARSSLKAVIMEINGSGELYGVRDDFIVKRMLDLGFKILRYEPFARSLMPLETTSVAGANAIFVRDENFVAARVAQAPQFDILGVRV